MNISASNSKFESLRRFFEADPGNARLRRDCVDAAVAAGEFGFVRDLADKRLASAPADPEAQFDRATALIGLQDFASALEALRPLDATIPGVRFNTGLCLFMLGRFEEARPYFQAGYDAGERSAGQLRVYLRTLHHVQDFDTATAVMKSNAELIASDTELAGVCAMLAIDTSDIAAGKRYAQMALAGNPKNLDALVAAGTLSAVELHVQQARAAFEQALTVQPENSRAWVGLGMLAMGDRNFSAAIPQLERGLAGMPGHIGSWHALAWAHLFGGDIDKAENVFRHALELNRNFGDSHGALGVIAAMRGDRAAAERFIEVAERLDPSGMTAKYASTLLAGSPEEGRRMLADLIETVPGHGPRFAAAIRQPNRGPKR
jgi:tetratricopeptide (TPR) repeat protein